LGLGRRRECAGFFVRDVDPGDAVGPPNRVHERVQAVSDHAVHTAYTSLQE
jgi:hypothetical protein